LDPGSGIRDPGSGMGKNQDPGSGINIPDPQHCFLHSINCACAGEAVEGQLPGQLEVCLFPHFLHLINCACAGEAVEGQLPGQLEVCLFPHFLHFIYCACAGEAVEGQLPGKLELCLSLTSYISIIAHAQVKLWRANYLDNWKCVYPSLLPSNLLHMRR
jgi:hypothetical protein